MTLDSLIDCKNLAARHNLCIGLQPDPQRSSRGGHRQTNSRPHMKFYMVLGSVSKLSFQACMSSTNKAYLGFSLGGCPTFRQAKRRWVSSCTVVSSVHTTSLKPSVRAAAMSAEPIEAASPRWRAKSAGSKHCLKRSNPAVSVMEGWCSERGDNHIQQVDVVAELLWFHHLAASVAPLWKESL